jgi:hypothetical protein
MKKDIPDLKVEDMAIAIAPRDPFVEEELWDSFILNFKEEPIRNVLVVSKGYGEDEKGERRKTTTLRHYFEQIGPLELQQIEPVAKDLFWLAHEYWVSFSYKGQIYDKKYVFVVGSLDTVNFTRIPLLDRKGVMIR